MTTDQPTNTLTDTERAAAKRLHDHGLCVEIPSDEGAHDNETAACHRFALAARGGNTDNTLRAALSADMYVSVEWANLTDGKWTHDPRSLCDHLAGVALDAAPAPTDNQHNNRLADRKTAERFLTEWTRPYFGPDANDAVAAVQRALRAVGDGPTTPTQEDR